MMLSMLFMFIIHRYAVPLRLSFHDTTDNSFLHAEGYDNFWGILDFCCDCLFITDILLNFITAYRTTAGVVVTDVRDIFKEYTRFWFWLDFTAGFPISWCVPNDSESGSGSTNKLIRMARFFKLAKLFRVFKMGRIWQRLKMHFDPPPGLVRLARLAIILITMWHFIACMYWYLSSKVGFCRWEQPDPEEGADIWNTWGNDGQTGPNGFHECGSRWTPWEQVTLEQTITVAHAQNMLARLSYIIILFSPVRRFGNTHTPLFCVS